MSIGYDFDFYVLVFLCLEMFVSLIVIRKKNYVLFFLWETGKFNIIFKF